MVWATCARILRQQHDIEDAFQATFLALARAARSIRQAVAGWLHRVALNAALKLKAGGVNPARFRVGAYGSDSAHRSELPPIAARRAEPYFGRVPSGADVVIIGDTRADIACGTCISARAVAVATGAYSVAELESCSPHAALEDLSDTNRVLEAIFAAHIS